MGEGLFAIAHLFFKERNIDLTLKKQIIQWFVVVLDQSTGFLKIDATH